MNTTLQEQLVAAQAEVKTHADEQTKLSQASAKIVTAIQAVEARKRAAHEATENAAQIGARRILGEASDRDAELANAAAAAARAAAAGADEAIAQLNRENELISARYQASVPRAAAAQNVCNQLRAAVITDAANCAAQEYMAAARAMADALVKLLAHARALDRIPNSSNFAPYRPQVVELPAFPGLKAFDGQAGHRLVIGVSDAATLDHEANAVLRRTDA